MNARNILVIYSPQITSQTPGFPFISTFWPGLSFETDPATINDNSSKVYQNESLYMSNFSGTSDVAHLYSFVFSLVLVFYVYPLMCIHCMWFLQVHVYIRFFSLLLKEIYDNLNFFVSDHKLFHIFCPTLIFMPGTKEGALAKLQINKEK